MNLPYKEVADLRSHLNNSHVLYQQFEDECMHIPGKIKEPGSGRCCQDQSLGSATQRVKSTRFRGKEDFTKSVIIPATAPSLSSFQSIKFFDSSMNFATSFSSECREGCSKQILL